MKGRGSSGISYISGGLKINTKSTCFVVFFPEISILFICELKEKRIQKAFDF